MDVGLGAGPKRRLDGDLAIGAIASILPKPSLIPEPAKTEDLIPISSPILCGGDDFRRLRK